MLQVVSENDVRHSQWIDVPCFPAERYYVVVEYGDEPLEEPQIAGVVTEEDEQKNTLTANTNSSLQDINDNDDTHNKKTVSTSSLPAVSFYVLLLFTIFLVLLVLSPKRRKELSLRLTVIIQRFQKQSNSSRRRFLPPV